MYVNINYQLYQFNQCSLVCSSDYHLYNHPCTTHAYEEYSDDIFPHSENYPPGPGNIYPLYADVELSPIPQLDGPCSPHQSLSLNYGPAQPQNQPNIRQAKYSLDTRLEDYEISVRPIAHNVTIKCSTGFYTQLVLPSFTSITLQYYNQVDGVIIRCSKIEGQIDGIGAR